MIDDRMKVDKPPVKTVSFTDMEALGFTIDVQELPKLKPSGEYDTAIRVLSIKKDNKPFPKSHTKEFLYVLGIDTLSEDSKYWVVKKKQHRCLSQKEPTYNYRFMGKERLDKSYLESGRCSMEAYLWASNMKDMAEQGEKLSNGGDNE